MRRRETSNIPINESRTDSGRPFFTLLVPNLSTTAKVTTISILRFLDELKGGSRVPTEAPSTYVGVTQTTFINTGRTAALRSAGAERAAFLQPYVEAVASQVV